MKTRFLHFLFGCLVMTASARLAAAEPTPFHGTPFQVPGRIEGEEFDLGGEGVAYHGLGSFVPRKQPQILVSPMGQIFIETNYPAIPRLRADADIGVGQGNIFAQPGKHLALRPGEWAVYTFVCRAAGHYSIQLKTQNVLSYSLGWRGDCVDSLTQSARPAEFHLTLDGATLPRQAAYTSDLILHRVWLAPGQHRLKLAADFVDELYVEFCEDADNSCPSEYWRTFTLPVDWIQVLPVAVPLREEWLAGEFFGLSPVKFADGPGTEARLNGAMIAGELADGSLLVVDEYNRAIRRVQGDGWVTTLSGNSPLPGEIAAGGADVPLVFRHSLTTPAGDVCVLLNDQGGTNLIVRVSATGQVQTVFAGLTRVPDVRQISGGPTNLPVLLNRLELMADGMAAAYGTYVESWESVCHGIPIGSSQIFRARFEPGTPGGLDWVDTMYDYLPDPPPPELGEGYRLENQQVVQHFTDSFPQQASFGILLHSAYVTRDGSRWASDGRAIYRLVPAPDASFLTVPNSADGFVEGVPTHPLRPDEAVTILAKPMKRFGVFSHWSDGNEENPRTLRISRDTQLTAHFGIRLPEPHGFRPRSFTFLEPDAVDFSLLGPSNPAEAPYTYQLEYSKDLKTWKAYGGRLQVGSQGKSYHHFAPEDQRYYRANLVVD